MVANHSARRGGLGVIVGICGDRMSDQLCAKKTVGLVVSIYFVGTYVVSEKYDFYTEYRVLCSHHRTSFPRHSIDMALIGSWIKWRISASSTIADNHFRRKWWAFLEAVDEPGATVE